ncbi:hypothetical protein [Microbaculum marinum]|uniref:Lysozyme inhibitor LprI N-terminal domain-containing protein n=1 Tax=Microbaculum marinum TaxID=1764581 RepID=A0AAW9RVZ2_9HYPH
MRTMRCIVMLLLGAAAASIAGNSRAASFDCAKAATPTEHAICEHPQLSQLDDQAAGLYYSLISGGTAVKNGSVAEVRSSQQQFLARRDACGADYQCLIGAYTDQIMFLKAAAGEGM